MARLKGRKAAEHTQACRVGDSMPANWLDYWHQFTQWVERHLGLAPETVDRLTAMALVAAGYILVTRVILRLVRRRVHDPARRYVLRKTVSYVLGVLLVVVLVRIWLGRFSGVLSYFGIVSAGVAVALQRPIVNFVAWIYIIVRRPFRVGDRIQIGDHFGDVLDVRLLEFTLAEIRQWVSADQSTGRLLHVPNGWVFEKAVCNYVQDFPYVWNEIPVTVTSESNWRKALAMLEAIADRYETTRKSSAGHDVTVGDRRFMLNQRDLQPAVWVSLSEIGTTLTLRFLSGPRNRRLMGDRISREILEAFEQQPDIDMAYPTTRVFNNRMEGKAQLRATDEGMGGQAG